MNQPLVGSVFVAQGLCLPLIQIKANYRQENPRGSRTSGDFLFCHIQWAPHDNRNDNSLNLQLPVILSQFFSGGVSFPL